MIEDLILKKSCNKKKIEEYKSGLAVLEEILNTVPIYFKHFSRHDVSHSQKILAYIENLLGNECLDLLSTSDLMMIVLACYSHDIGMALTWEEIEEWFSDRDFVQKTVNELDSKYPDFKQIINDILCQNNISNVDTQDLGNELLKKYFEVEIIIETVFRKGHAERSFEIIKKNDLLEKLLTIRCQSCLANICKLHDQNIEKIMELPIKENGIFDDFFHPRFIAALLSLGDLLDMDTDRFDSYRLKASSKMPRLSELHKLKHESVKHYLVEKNKIEIIADCQDIEVYRLMRQWTDWIRTASEFLVLNWDDITPDPDILPPRIKQCEISIQGNKKWIDYSDTKLKIDSSRAIEILEGSNLYKGKHTFFKEIIQNAIDASLIQLVLEAETLLNKKGISLEDVLNLIDEGKINIHEYDISGKVFSDDDGVVCVEIRDYGVGISKEEINNLANLNGKSEKLKKIISRMPNELRPSGAFGVGILSAFQVSDCIEYITKVDDENTKKISLLSPENTGYIVIEDLEQPFKRGTQVKVKLNPQKFNQSDFGLSDYLYNTERDDKILLSWLYRQCNNVEKRNIPIFEYSRQLMDYFNVDIIINNDKVCNDFVKRFSVLQERHEDELSEITYKIKLNTHIHNWKQIKTPCIKYIEGRIEYIKFDFEKGCEFKAVFYVPFDYDEENKEITCGNMLTYYRFMQSLWYRFSKIKENVLSNKLADYRRLYEMIDYNINIVSDNAENIMTINRTDIKDEYVNTLASLVKYEINQMCIDIIDDFLGTGGDGSKNNIILSVYYLSVFSNYKTDEVKDKFSDILNKIYVIGFKDIAFEDIKIELCKLTNESFYILTELDSSNPVLACDSKLWNNTKKIPDNSNIINAAYSENERNIFDFKLTEVFYTEYQEKKYLVKKVQVVNGDEFDTASERDDICKELDFLEIICGLTRCVSVSKGYEMLATSPAEGLNYYANSYDRIIEAMLDEGIRQELFKELMEGGFIKAARTRYLQKICDSERYKKNVEYIVKCSNNKYDKEMINQKYMNLFNDFLGLVEKEIFISLNKNTIQKINDNDGLFNFSTLYYAGKQQSIMVRDY